VDKGMRSKLTFHTIIPKNLMNEISTPHFSGNLGVGIEYDSKN